MPNILRAKCLLIGGSTVGKTAITQMFTSDGTSFPKNYNMTCGVDITIKSVNIPESSDIVELFIYDCGGRDIFKDLVNKVSHHPSMVIAVYDVASEESLRQAAKWAEMIKERAGRLSYPGVLLANKTDLSERRVLSPKVGKEVAKQLGLVYFECSAKANDCVEEPFFYLSNEWHKEYTEKTNTFHTLMVP